MASITVYWRNANEYGVSQNQGRYFLMVLRALSSTVLMNTILLLLFWVASSINNASAQAAPKLGHQSAENIGLELSSEVQDAIQNGVSIMFLCQYAERKTFWFLSRSANIKQHHFSLKRHALSNQYIVKRNDLNALKLFRSLDEATRYIAAQSVLQLEFYHDSDTLNSMRLSLNKFDLPAPMRLKAFLSSAWDVDTGWVLW
jgi:hypothetical protein